jgi:type IV pilus assembly protein PilQ
LAYQAARLQNPDRLVLDFAGARLKVSRSRIEGVAPPVHAVRLGQYKPDVTRVVIELTTAVPCKIERDSHAVVILFPVPQAAPVGAFEPKGTATAPLHKTDDVPFLAPSPRLARPAASRGALPAPRIDLPLEITQPAVFASFRDNGQALPPVPQAPAQQTAGASPNVAATPEKYTGEPISVNLKDVDLKDFFRLIHEISGLNVVVDQAVRGSLTIVLDEVPWDQALDIVLQNNNLDKQLVGNVLRIATRDTLKKEAQDRRDLANAQASAMDQVTVTRVLSYAKATSMRDTLKRFLSSRGDILADERSNQLIIRDIPQVIPTLDNLIRQLDKKSQQVEIEARVVQASRSFARDIGTQLAFASSTTGGRSVFGGTNASNIGPSPVGTGTGLPVPPLISMGSSSNQMPLVTNFAPTSPTSGIGFYHRSPNFAVDFMILAAESKGVGKLLSKPKVITQNNEKATVKQGQKIPIQTNINNTISVQYIDAVLQLEVTPQITADGTVFMDVLVENTQIDTGIPRVMGIPALDTQSAETKVTVVDGGTVVIGGVMVTNQRVDVNQVPWIGSIPLIGHLFKENSVTVQSQELLFFLTPRILPG